MKSPFPGMDPYIEASPYWGDFHSHLIERIFDQIADHLPDRYFARTNVRSYIQMVEPEGKKDHPFFPDVTVQDRSRAKRSGGRGRAAVAESPASETPIEIRAFIPEEHREGFVEIYEAIEGQPRLVTAIEVLSPTNKRPGEGRDLYLRKRNGLMLGWVNLIELDLLRGGERMPMVDPWPNSPYVLMVARRSRGHYCKVWKGYPDRPLPSLPVPLADPDPDLRIDIQPMVDTIYRRSRYGAEFDYTKPLTPPLSADEAAFLATRRKGRRK